MKLKILVAFLSLVVSAMAQTTGITINRTTGQINAPTDGGAVPNFTSLKVGSVTITPVAYGSGVATFLATPSSSNFAAAVTGETGTGALVFGTSPDFTTGATIGGVAVPTISSSSTFTNKTIVLSNNTVNFLNTGVAGVSRNLQTKLRENLPTPQDFGAIADGSTHPLSGVYGSLGAAQVKYPFATALTQEIDFCAVQSCANLGSFYLPPGIYLLGSSTVRTVNSSTTGGQSIAGDGITISGAGPDLTLIQSTADAFHIMGRYQTFRDFSIAGPGSIITPTRTTANGITLGESNYSNNFHLVHVTVRNFNRGFYNPDGWDACSLEYCYLYSNFVNAETSGNQDCLKLNSTTLSNDGQFSLASCGTTNTSDVVTVGSTTSVHVGSSVTGTNIPDWTSVTEITDATHFKISNAATGTGTVTLSVGSIGLACRGSGRAEWNGGVSGGNSVSITGSTVSARNVHFEGCHHTYIIGATGANMLLDRVFFADGSGVYRHVFNANGNVYVASCGVANPGITGSNGRVYIYTQGYTHAFSPDRTAVENNNGVALMVCGDYEIQSGDNALPGAAEVYRGVRYWQAYASPFWTQRDALWMCINNAGSYDWVQLLDGGNPTLSKTITAGGTTGNQTINKASGSVNFAALAQTITLTNSNITANSVITCTVATDDTTAKSCIAVPGAGTATLKLNAAATAETRVNWIVTN